MEQEIKGDFKMPWGKYKGECLDTIYMFEKKYLIWIVENLEDSWVKVKVEEFLLEKEGDIYG